MERKLRLFEDELAKEGLTEEFATVAVDYGTAPYEPTSTLVMNELEVRTE